jgi:hypothetical protein
MNKLTVIIGSIRLAYKRALGYIPELLPVGKAEMHRFMDEIIEISGQFADIASMKYVIANMIQGLSNTTTGRVSKQYFSKAMRKVAANQVAAAVFKEVKEARDAAIAEEQKLQAEVTAHINGNNSGETKNSTTTN